MLIAPIRGDIFFQKTYFFLQRPRNLTNDSSQGYREGASICASSVLTSRLRVVKHQWCSKCLTFLRLSQPPPTICKRSDPGSQGSFLPVIKTRRPRGQFFNLHLRPAETLIHLQRNSRGSHQQFEPSNAIWSIAPTACCFPVSKSFSRTQDTSLT